MLRLPLNVWQAVIAHLKALSPLEGCGFLGGIVTPTGGRVTQILPVSNISPTPHLTYEMEPLEQFKALTGLQESGHEPLAIYHSHPAGPALPSSIDLRKAFWPGEETPLYPGVFYLIVSLIDLEPSAGLFRLEKQAFQKAALQIET